MLKETAFLIVFALFIVMLFVAATTSISPVPSKAKRIPNYGIAVVAPLVLVDVILTMFVLM